MNHTSFDTRPSDVDFALLYRLHRDRDDWVNEERSLTLRQKSRLRRLASLTCDNHKPKCPRCVGLANEWYSGKGDPAMVMATAELNAPLAVAQQPIHAIRLQTEREMTSIIKASPYAEFADERRGVGYLGLATILAETGDPLDYSNPSKLWKRMGLAVIDGKPQRRVKGEGAIEQGFSPKRRAVMFCVGDALVKVGDTYRAVYLERKAYEVERNPEIKPIAAHRRAQRYMEKRLLRDLWQFARR